MFPDRLEGVTDEYEARGMSPSTGRFQKGNGFGKGRPKGRRNVLTQMLLDHAAAAELQPFEVLYDIYRDDTIPPDLRFKAASKYADLIYPKAASVEVKIEDDNTSEEMVDNKIRDFLFEHLGVDVLPPSEEDEVQEAE